jgi:Ca-activated chloride channel homolog
MKQRPGHRVLVPLRSIEYHAEIVDTIVLMSLTQQYFNPTDKFLEVEYRFPVPPEACIYRFAATFAKTRIEGVVKEKEEARKEYEEAIKEGRKAALGELDSESRDILCLKVGNVPPGETVTI